MRIQFFNYVTKHNWYRYIIPVWMNSVTWNRFGRLRGTRREAKIYRWFNTGLAIGE